LNSISATSKVGAAIMSKACRRDKTEESHYTWVQALGLDSDQASSFLHQRGRRGREGGRGGQRGEEEGRSGGGQEAVPADGAGVVWGGIDVVAEFARRQG
jgi:hypothetical protein